MSEPIVDPWPVVVEPEPEDVPVVSDEERRQARILRHRAEMFAQLAAVPGYAEMLLEFERKRQRMRTDFLAFHIDGGEEINQRQVDYDRGFKDGMVYIEQVVENAQKYLAGLDAASEEAAAESEPDDTEVWP